MGCCVCSIYITIMIFVSKSSQAKLTNKWEDTAFSPLLELAILSCRPFCFRPHLTLEPVEWRIENNFLKRFLYKIVWEKNVFLKFLFGVFLFLNFATYWKPNHHADKRTNVWVAKMILTCFRQKHLSHVEKTKKGFAGRGLVYLHVTYGHIYTCSGGVGSPVRSRASDTRVAPSVCRQFYLRTYDNI